MEELIRVSIDVDFCKGCELCVHTCPRKIIAVSDEINVQGFHPARITDQSKCTSCGLCARMCPDCAITVFR
ncbi:MAG TPA: 4Fe-4S binding protein [Firmicutes bacterium]|nr:4Fe-4S binding protein [Bacillota bacterium]